MKKKTMRKLAKEIAELNKMYEDPSSSEKEKNYAEEKIYSITRQVLSSPHGLELLDELDSIIRTLL